MHTRRTSSNIALSSIALLWLAVTVGAGLLSVPAEAATYRWVESQGGRWEDVKNWHIPGYPRFFWDFALFDLDAAYEVDASSSPQIQAVGMLAVSAGDVTLQVPAGFVTVVGVGTNDSPAALTLRAGVINGGGTHTIGSRGVLTLGAGVQLRSSSSSSFGFSIEDGGVLRGDGGSLENHVLRNFGTVSPGSLPGRPGLLLMGRAAPAGYLQRESGVLEIEIGGPTPGEQHDQLRIESAALPVELDGALAISMIDGYRPGDGERFEILVAPAISGEFATVDLPDVQGVEFEIVYAETTVSVVAHGASSAPAIALDILPGGCPNPLGVRRQGVLPAALIGTDAIDLHDIEPASLLLEGVAPLRWSFEDVAAPTATEGCACEETEPDGIADLTLKFPADRLLTALQQLTHGDTRILSLTGNLRDGTRFVTEDCIVMRGSGGGSNGGGGSGATGDADPERRGKKPRIAASSLPSATTQQVTIELPEASTVRVSLFDVQGRLKGEVIRAEGNAGEHVFEWDASHVPQGVYFYRLETDRATSTAKVVLFH